MNRSSTLQLAGHFSIALICAALTGCATTQRSSTSAADQATPPAAASTERAVAPPSSPEPTTQAATTTVSPPVAKARAGADEGGPMEFPNTKNDTAGETNSVKPASELKQKLDEQDAEINKIRQRQETGATTVDKEAAPEAAPASHAEATPAATIAETPRKEAPVAPRKEEE